ncbi:hypothetical protein ABH930_004562 [Kitasatospora sp. GAS204A]|nr:hypothetical protein [Kitasatospora sp. GAS204B]
MSATEHDACLWGPARPGPLLLAFLLLGACYGVCRTVGPPIPDLVGLRQTPLTGDMPGMGLRELASAQAAR